ncbi:hypothetical protein GCM10010211_38100 [Streptomyces albospinus]|uniref:Uncharacterized protein n=1 Tax=Streptomyces albospinus TaxID=285515 RepID=A0ABQ2V650_9ACTN|nr:hypothetical protein GCM10010211_38100 [Streptomyces albospinus]
MPFAKPISVRRPRNHRGERGAQFRKLTHFPEIVRRVGRPAPGGDRAGDGRWPAARNRRAKGAAYGFDWSTDYCTRLPDNPFGFPFKTSCARQDFGYRSDKEAGTFAVDEPRVDRALYEDFERVCAVCSGARKSSCNALAWT